MKKMRSLCLRTLSFSSIGAGRRSPLFMPRPPHRRLRRPSFGSRRRIGGGSGQGPCDSGPGERRSRRHDHRNDQRCAGCRFDKVGVTLPDVANQVGQNKIAINFVWTLVTGFLVMFMQAGFAMVESGSAG